MSTILRTICRTKFRRGIGVGARLAKSRGMSEDDYVQLCQEFSGKILVSAIKTATGGL